MHHHVVHYPGQQAEHKGYEFMVDSPRLLEFLEGYDFDIVLTGHKHHSYGKIEHFKDKDMFIIGGPTVGGDSNENRCVKPTVMTFLEFPGSVMLM